MQIEQMKTRRVAPFVNRTYRSGGSYQWVRETLVNSKEAGATRVNFGVERQGMTRGIYRRTIEDNGKGMTPDQLREFFGLLGEGEKTIGGEHENFGVGAKTSLLPWNKFGVVIVSWTKECPRGSMIHILYDQKSLEYGLRRFETDQGFTTVVEPFDDDLTETDWSAIKPEWMTTTGTIITLLGNHDKDQTVQGDMEKDAGTVRGICKYINSRFFHLGHLDVTVDEVQEEAVKEGVEQEDIPWTRFRWSDYKNRPVVPRVAHGFIGPMVRNEPKHGVMDIDEHGTKLRWFLHEDFLPVGHEVTKRGFIGVLYNGEIYNIESHHNRYGSYGISEKEVRNKLWLILVSPPHLDGQTFGVYPTENRNVLLWGRGAESLPHDEWGDFFSWHLPEEIMDASNRAHRELPPSDDETAVQEELLKRYGALWGLEGYNDNEDGEGGKKVRPEPHKREPWEPNPDPVVKRPRKATVLPEGEGAKGKKSITAGLPHCAFVPDNENFPEGCAIVFTEPNLQFPRGFIAIWEKHPEYVKFEDRHLRSVKPGRKEEGKGIVRGTIKAQTTATVAHQNVMHKYLGESAFANMRTPEALTGAMLGFYAQDDLVARMFKNKRLVGTK